jgi:hypothetical protein
MVSCYSLAARCSILFNIMCLTRFLYNFFLFLHHHHHFSLLCIAFFCRRPFLSDGRPGSAAVCLRSDKMKGIVQFNPSVLLNNIYLYILAFTVYLYVLLFAF